MRMINLLFLQIRMSVFYFFVRIMVFVLIVLVFINVIVKLVGRIRIVSKVFECFIFFFVLYICIKIFIFSKCYCIVYILNNDFFLQIEMNVQICFVIIMVFVLIIMDYIYVVVRMVGKVMIVRKVNLVFRQGQCKF